MKKNFLTFFFALITSSIFALPGNERCITFTENSPFKVTAKGDGVLVGACVATTATALALPYILDLPDYDERTYYMNSIDDLDRKFARKYNRTIHNAGTVTVAGCYLITPALYLAEYSLGNFDFHEGLMVAVMFAETVGIGNSVKNFLKVAFQRKRPYMYFDGFPEDKLSNHDFEFSFPSGHTLDAFATASFASYTFCRYFPESNYRIPVIAGSYALAATTAFLRVASGNHFVTDVLSGAAIGTVIGLSVPWLHTFAAKASTDKVQLSLSPVSAALTIRL